MGGKGGGERGKGGKATSDAEALFRGGGFRGVLGGNGGEMGGGEWGEMEKGLGGLGSGCFGFDSFLAIRARHLVWFSLFLDRS